MKVIDDQGRVFGFINIIDALVILLIVAVVVAGTALVFSGEETETQEVVVTVEAEKVKPYVAKNIPVGEVDSDSVLRVENKSVEPSKLIVTDQNGEIHVRDSPVNKTVVVEVVMSKTVGSDLRYNGREIKIGRKIMLDLGDVVVKGRVKGIN